MPEPDPAKILNFTSPKDLGRWLEENHASESELWIRIFKKGSGVPSVTWEDVVKAGSNWSKRNRELTSFIQGFSKCIRGMKDRCSLES